MTAITLTGLGGFFVVVVFRFVFSPAWVVLDATAVTKPKSR